MGIIRLHKAETELCLVVKSPMSVDVDELYLGSHTARKPYDSHSGCLYLRSDRGFVL